MSLPYASHLNGRRAAGAMQRFCRVRARAHRRFADEHRPAEVPVYVDGQEGTTGLRIHEMLAARADLELLRIAPELRKDDAERARLLNAADVAFLCLPDDASRAAAKMITNPHTCLIDASTAHRTDPSWVYGLPELAPGQREALRTAKRIANPGCHATAFILLMRPLVDAGLVAPDADVTATSITGYSGGGKKMIEQYQSLACAPDGRRAPDRRRAQRAASLRAGPGAQAHPRDEDVLAADARAGVHAHRGQLLQGPDGEHPVPPRASCAAGTDAREGARRAGRSATPTSRSSA